MVSGRATLQKKVDGDGFASDTPSYTSQVGTVTGRFELLAAGEIPNDLKDENRKIYAFRIPGNLTFTFPNIGVGAPVPGDRLILGLTGQVYDIVGVGDIPTGTAMITKLILAEVSPQQFLNQDEEAEASEGEAVPGG